MGQVITHLSLLTAAIMALVVISCGSNSDIGSPESSSIPPAPIPATVSVDTQVRDISLFALDNRFEPAQIRVGSGEAVRITAFNQGLEPHTFTFRWEGEEVDLSMLGGESQSTETIKLAGKPGTVIPFRCRWHASSDFKVGMMGSILVVEKPLTEKSGVD